MNRGRTVCLELRGYLENEEWLECKVLRVNVVSRVLAVFRVLLDLRAHRVLRVRRVTAERLDETDLKA